MRPSSSPSDASRGPGARPEGLFDRLEDPRGVVGATGGTDGTDDAAVLAALLEFEAALAAAEADLGIVTAEAAEVIGRVAASGAGIDLTEVGRAGEAAGNPVVALVRALGAALPESARPWVHHGATSQDALDTALSLVAHRVCARALDDLDAAVHAAAALARRHRDTLMVGRTLGQQAVPITFGLKVAGWLTGLDEARRTLAAAQAGLAVQLGGAAGTLAPLGEAGVNVAARLADRLGLAEPPLPWHTHRARVLALAAALGGLAAATGKVGLDVTLLAQTEIGEVSEGGEGRGGSSAMPHKRNAVDALLLVATARRTPGLVATLFTAAVHEHERAAGAWQAEWVPLLDLLRLAAGAAARVARLLDGLQVHPDRMRANLELTGGLLLAEAVATRLAPALGRTGAHDVVRRAARTAADEARPLRDVLLADPDVRAYLDAAAVDEALDPARWLGSAGAFVDRALAAAAHPVGDHAQSVERSSR